VASHDCFNHIQFMCQGEWFQPRCLVPEGAEAGWWCDGDENAVNINCHFRAKKHALPLFVRLKRWVNGLDAYCNFDCFSIRTASISYLIKNLSICSTTCLTPIPEQASKLRNGCHIVIWPFIQGETLGCKLSVYSRHINAWTGSDIRHHIFIVTGMLLKMLITVCREPCGPPV
jgi:hypothetical protein